MYNDTIEYINYVKEKDVLLHEPIHELEQKDFFVLNQELQFDEISKEYERNGYAIIDNFLKVEYAQRLRYFVYNINVRHDFYKDYAGINFSKTNPFFRNIWFPLLTSIVNETELKFPLLRSYRYDRGWAFIHDNHQVKSVGPHTDMLPLTLNIWTTPDECIETNSAEFNGIVVSDAKRTEEFYQSKKTIIPYKFNRAVFFNGNTVHHSLKARFKIGYENRKVNYTFLFDRK